MSHAAAPPATKPPGTDAHAASTGRRFLQLGAGEAAARLLAFVATVYLARTLGASVYGVIVSATTVIMYLTFVADAGMDMIGVREVAAHPDRVASLLGGVLGSRLLLVALLLVGTTLTGLVILPRPDGPALAMYAVTLVATALGTRFVHVGLDRAGNAAWSRVVSESLTALLVLSLVRSPEHLLRVPMAQIAGEVTAALLLLRWLPPTARPERLRVDLRATAALVQRAWPMIAHGILGLAIFNSDFLFLRVMKGAEQVGYYAVAYTLISFFQNLGVAYTMSLIPGLTSLRGDRAATQRLVDDATAQVAFGALPIAAGGVLVARALVTLLFGSAYAPSVDPLLVLLLLIPVALFRNVLQAVLVAHEQQERMLRTVVWAAASNVVLNLALIPRWGMVGAALATLITEVVRTVLSARYAVQEGVARTPLRRLRHLLVATVVMTLVVWPLRTQPVFVSVPAGGVAYLLTLVAFGAIRLRRSDAGRVSLSLSL
ncbi:MAG: flippase [Gemmatimonadetes bacterium]|nr:flippase [Gemmatimonadota bacterium]